MGLASILKSRLIPAELENHINRIRKPIGSLGYDPWGYNNEVMKYGFSLTRQIYERYFRVEATGVDKIPSEGPVLIVASDEPANTPLLNTESMNSGLAGGSGGLGATMLYVTAGISISLLAGMAFYLAGKNRR